MILVFIFCAIVIIITLLICMIILSTLKIKISNLEASNITNVKEKSLKNPNKKAQVNISFCLFNYIKWFGLKLDEKKFNKMYEKIKLGKIDLKKLEQDFKLRDLLQLKKLKAEIEYLNLELKIGTEDVILTSFIVAVISTLISIILPYLIKRYQKDKYYYKILPLYNNNAYEIKFDCIINIKLVHIINILYYQFKKGRKKNDGKRTSNRRSYGYSYE